MKFKSRDKKTLQKRIDNFIYLGKKKHGSNRYDYSAVHYEYKNNRTPVHIKCNMCDNLPFKVYPFVHTNKGDNQKGTCPHCYVPKKTVQETRWNKNIKHRIKEFKVRMFNRHKGRYAYPYLGIEYKNENSIITVKCNQCNTKPFKRLVRALKAEDRYAGCEVCNKNKMVKIIKKKNKIRQLRNRRTQNIPRDYGCIYKITNTKNNKFYIGYTTMTSQKRLKAHVDETRRMQNGHKGKSSYLHNSMAFHGIEHFKVKVLEEFTNVTPIFLGTLEKEYIEREKPHYNLSPGGELGAHKNK